MGERRSEVELMGRDEVRYAEYGIEVFGSGVKGLGLGTANGFEVRVDVTSRFVGRGPGVLVRPAGEVM